MDLKTLKPNSELCAFLKLWPAQEVVDHVCMMKINENEQSGTFK